MFVQSEFRTRFPSVGFVNFGLFSNVKKRLEKSMFFQIKNEDARWLWVGGDKIKDS